MFKNLSPSALGISGHESEIIELALTYGFKGMDLEVADFATRAKLRGMSYARRLIDSAKIRLGAFQLPFNWETADEVFKKDLERLPEHARAAAELECTRCVATLSPASDKRPYHENFEFHRRRLSQICEALRPAGIWFGVGFQAAEYLRKDRPFQFIHDLDALTLLINMVDAPNIGLLLDIWDLGACGGSMETIRNLPLGQIVAVQVADMPADTPLSEMDKNSRLLPGSENSQIDTVGALITLADFGYNGPVTPKPSRGIFQSRRRDVIVKQTGEAMDRVWRAAGLTAEGTLSAPVAPAEG
jgi:sugar phosphate isomerase/epimerase